jgi:hypothetical protein
MTEAILNLSVRQERAEQFRALHAQPPLMLASVWDAGSADIIGAAGAMAIATSRGGSCRGLRLSRRCAIDVPTQAARIAAARAAADSFGRRPARTTNGQVALFPCAAKKDHLCLA